MKPLRVIGLILLLFVVGTLGAFIGVLLEDLRNYNVGIEKDRRILADVLKKRPAYSSLEIIEYSAGHSWLDGTVPSDEDYKQLEHDVIDAVGRDLLDRRMMNVSVERGKAHVD